MSDATPIYGREFIKCCIGWGVASCDMAVASNVTLGCGVGWTSTAGRSEMLIVLFGATSGAENDALCAHTVHYMKKV